MPAAKQKASALAGRFRNAADAPVSVEAPAPPSLAGARRAARSDTSKYTVLFGAADSEILDDFVRDARKSTGRRSVGKSDVLRALVQQIAADQALQGRVLEQLQRD